jgi:hypothetical protein
MPLIRHRYLARGALRLGLLAFLLVPRPLVSAPAEGGAEIQIVIAPHAVRKVIHAAVPYELRLDVGFFQQVVSLTEPRQIQLIPGGIRLEMTAVGSPLPFTVDIAPELKLVRDPGSGDHRLEMQSLPVNMGRIGTYDLSAYVGPIPIERVTRHLLDTPGRQMEVDLIVDRVEIVEEGIEIFLVTDFQ